jgi:hypothetical protein
MKQRLEAPRRKCPTTSYNSLWHAIRLRQIISEKHLEGSCAEGITKKTIFNSKLDTYEND